MNLTFAGTHEGVIIRCDVKAHILCDGRGYARGECIPYSHIKESTTVIATFKGMSITRFIPDEFFAPDAPRYEEKYEPTPRPKADYAAYQRELAAQLMAKMQKELLDEYYRSSYFK